MASEPFSEQMYVGARQGAREPLLSKPCQASIARTLAFFSHELSNEYGTAINGFRHAVGKVCGPKEVIKAITSFRKVVSAKSPPGGSLSLCLTFWRQEKLSISSSRNGKAAILSSTFPIQVG